MESAPEDAARPRERSSHGSHQLRVSVGVCDLGGPFRGLRKEEACWRKWTNVEARRSKLLYMCH